MQPPSHLHPHPQPRLPSQPQPVFRTVSSPELLGRSCSVVVIVVEFMYASLRMSVVAVFTILPHRAYFLVGGLTSSMSTGKQPQVAGKAAQLQAGSSWL